MLDHKKIRQESADFFSKEVDKVIAKVTTATTEKSRNKYLKQMVALRNRIALEVKMLEDIENS